jgi:hypothetical protein
LRPLIIVCLVARAADACSVCGCGDPLVDASDSIPAMSTLRFAVDGEVLTQSAASDDTPGVTESITQVTIRPAAIWSPSRAFNLVAEVPIVWKSFAVTGEAPVQHAGLGDVDAGIRWFPIQHIDWSARSRQDAGVSIGTSLPTGPIGARDDAGMLLDEHAQLGTGAFGPYAGLVYAYHRDPWNLFASATVRVRSTNAHGYRYGTAFLWTARADFRVKEPLAIELALDGREALRDTMDGAAQANTGGLVLAASPGLVWNPVNRLWLRARVQIPFVAATYGTQSIGPTALLSAQVVLR